MRISPTTCSIGSYGGGPGQLDWPEDVAFDSSGKMFIADYKNNRIQVFNREGQFLYQFYDQGHGYGLKNQLNNPTSVFIDSNDCMCGSTNSCLCFHLPQ